MRPTHPVRLTAIACCLGLLTTGCSALKPSAGAPEPTRAAELLRQGDGLLAADDFDGARGVFTRLLAEYPNSEEAPQALLELATVYLSPDSDLHDLDRAHELLERLARRHPDSPWGRVASAYLARQPLRLEPTDVEVRAPAGSAPALLDRAGRSLSSADWESATVSLNMLLASYPDSPQAPQALFLLAAIYLLPESTLTNRQTGFEMLTDLRDQHPESPWAAAAEAVRSLIRTNGDLRQAVSALRTQLDELKKLDLESDG